MVDFSTWDNGFCHPWIDCLWGRMWSTSHMTGQTSRRHSCTPDAKTLSWLDGLGKKGYSSSWIWIKVPEDDVFCRWVSCSAYHDVIVCIYTYIHMYIYTYTVIIHPSNLGKRGWQLKPGHFWISKGVLTPEVVHLASHAFKTGRSSSSLFHGLAICRLQMLNFRDRHHR